jgi:hypothetical protein
MTNRAHRRPETSPDQPQPKGFFDRLLRFIGPSQGVDQFPVAGTASSRVEAELMAGFLRNQGIKAVVSADDEGGLSPALQTGNRVRILVPRDQHGRAQQLIEQRK